MWAHPEQKNILVGRCWGFFSLVMLVSSSARCETNTSPSLDVPWTVEGWSSRGRVCGGRLLSQWGEWKFTTVAPTFRDKNHLDFQRKTSLCSCWSQLRAKPLSRVNWWSKPLLMFPDGWNLHPKVLPGLAGWNVRLSGRSLSWEVLC